MERQRYIGIVEETSNRFVFKRDGGYRLEPQIRLRNIRQNASDAVILNTLELSFTPARSRNLRNITWGDRIEFTASATDDAHGHICLKYPTRFNRLAAAPRTKQVLETLTELQLRSERYRNEHGDEDITDEQKDFRRKVRVHEIGHAIVSDATGGWVEMIVAAERYDRRGNLILGECRDYESCDMRAILAAGYAAERLEYSETDHHDSEFDDDKDAFENELIDETILKAQRNTKRVEGTSDVSHALIATLFPLDNEVFSEEWSAAVDRATLMLLERRPFFDVLLDALELSPILWHGRLVSLGFARSLGAEERNSSIERSMHQRIEKLTRREQYDQIQDIHGSNQDVNDGERVEENVDDSSRDM